MEYILILGNSSDLARQEALNVLNGGLGSVQEMSKDIGQNFVLIKSDLSAPDLIKKFGGVIKIAKIKNNLNSLDRLSADMVTGLITEQTSEKNRLNFGFSFYSDSKKQFFNLQKLFLQVKKNLTSSGQSARLVSSKEQILSSVIVKKNNLVGHEVLIIPHQNNWIIGLTLAVQDFDSYQFRDMKRPERDNKSGMLPPKIAQMMLNLADTDRQRVLLDPFCGSGTIVQEAALLGFRKIIATDGSKKAVAAAEKNIDWLKQHYKATSKFEIRVVDVHNLADTFPHSSIDLIVTEPYKGDARFVLRVWRINDLYRVKAELQDLYLAAFRNFREIIKSGGKVVFIFPIFRIQNKLLPTLEQEKISKLGFKLIKPEFGSPLSRQKNIVYSRDEQKVLREITVWEAL